MPWERNPARAVLHRSKASRVRVHPQDKAIKVDRAVVVSTDNKAAGSAQARRALVGYPDLAAAQTAH